MRHGAQGSSRREALIDAGSDAGLRKGMVLFPEDISLFSRQLVDSVEKDRAVVKTMFPEGNFRWIKEGDVVYSRLPGFGRRSATVR